MVRVCQGTVLRTQCGIGILVPLYAPGGHQQPTLVVLKRGSSYVQMEGLPGARKTSTKNHDPGRGRVYATLPATCAAKRVSSHTTLRHSGQLKAGKVFGAGAKPARSGYPARAFTSE